MKRVVPRLTYANVMATVAVFIALGGASYAAIKLPKNSVGTKQIKKNAVTSSKVKNGSLKANDFAAGQLPKGPQGIPGEKGEKGDPGASATTLWARVRQDGLLLLNSNATGSKRIETGKYEVAFNRDVSKCGFVGSMASSAGEIEVERQGEHDEAVSVETFNSSGLLADRIFTVAVLC